MSVPAPAQEGSARDAIAGLMASLAIFVSFVGLVYRPVRVTPGAMLFALVAAGMSRMHSRLAAFALGAAAVCFVVGTTLAVVLNKPIF